MLGAIQIKKEKLINLYVRWMVEWYDNFLKNHDQKLNCNVIFNEFITSIIWMENDELDKYKLDKYDFNNFKKWEIEIKNLFIEKWKEKRKNEKTE